MAAALCGPQIPSGFSAAEFWNCFYGSCCHWAVETGDGVVEVSESSELGLEAANLGDIHPGYTACPGRCDAEGSVAATVATESGVVGSGSLALARAAQCS